jgi:tetratricopeptide (TPR) repeat protein
MLYLLNSPAWAPPDQPLRPLPLTLPAALLVVLATQASWMTREQLALVFWPDAAPGDALHHLRINLHRARSLLAGWGLADALQAERSRVRLTLPSDLALLREAQERGDATLLARLSPAQWLQGWRLPGNEGFAQWCDETAQCLQDDWLAAGRRRAPAASSHPAEAAPPGRETALHQLLDSAAPALLLLGEPGAGKTTLLRAAWPQAPCLRGLEGLHGMPYRPLLDVLREHSATLQRALRDPRHPLRPYRLDLARLLPELAPDEPLPPLDAVTARSRLVEALARAFEALCPLLLVDDLQWCDEASVEWLLMLAHTGRLRWRAAARSHEMPAALQQALQPLRHAARLQEMTLAPLDAPGLSGLFAQRFPGQACNAQQLARLQALSGGNALLAVELLQAGLGDDAPQAGTSVPERVARLVLGRLQRLPPVVRHAVEAAAVFVQPVPAAALRRLAGLPAAADLDDDSPWTAACDNAVAAGLLRQEGEHLACRHDLIRQAIAQTLQPGRRLVLHRHAALWLAAQPGADALTIAEHWRAAAEPQTALAWRHQGAEQLKARGRFDEAKALWHEVAEDSLDATQALRARLELAACDLFEDLARGEAALNAVVAQLAAVADAEQHRQIEGRALAALVDNRVFAGDIARAREHAARLRVLLPELTSADRIDALEVLIELAMREPDIPVAWALLAQLRLLAPRRPSLLSWEGQIHWFGGQVQAAHDALARLLERHPDYCRGITVENDLAVMLQALGHLPEAEAMARRSLASWAGVAHTETLSLLVLGLTLTSAGRHEEADAALLQALHLAKEQASPGFEAEARVRRARLLLARGQPADAQTQLDLAAPLLQASPEPLRVSQLVLAQVQAAVALHRPLPLGAVRRLEEVALRSEHPLVQTRLARVQFEAAMLRSDHAAAQQAAQRQEALARAGGLQEVVAEAQALQSRTQT